MIRRFSGSIIKIESLTRECEYVRSIVHFEELRMALVRITTEYAAQIRVRGSMDPRCIIRDLQNYAFLRIHAACKTWLDKDTFKAQLAVHAIREEEHC